jgi:PAS domain S-box-containing protein
MFDSPEIEKAALGEVLQQMASAVMIVEAPSGENILQNRQTQQMSERYLGRSVLTRVGDLRDLHESGVFELVRPDGRPYEFEEWPIMRSLTSGEVVRDEDLLQRMADGTQLWLRCNSSPIYDDEGLIVTGTLVVHDITERKQAEEQLAYHARLLENMQDAVIATDEQLLVKAWNKGAERMYGWTADEALGREVRELVSLDMSMSDEQLAEAIREIEETGRLHVEQIQYHKDGASLYIDSLTIAMRNEQGEITGYLAINRDISERKQAQKEVETRTHQQAVVAEIGLWALANNDVQSFMDDTVAFVAQTLDVEYCKIVELLAGGQELLLRAGMGWREGLVGNTTEASGLDSQAGYTLLSEEPVIVEDLSTETRFRVPPLLHEHGVVSSMTVVISGRGGPFGVLGVHTKSRRTFSEDDVNFLQAGANVLAMRIERDEVQKKLEEVREAERSRIARDLHDEALQDLTEALVEAQLAQAISKDPELDRRLGRLVAVLDRMGPHLRRVIYDLRLEGEQNKPFSELLELVVEVHREMVSECNINLQIQDGGLEGPRGQVGREVLRIVGEALANARRHSGAHNIRVSVWTFEDKKLWAEVSDDGQGFDPEKEPPATTTGGMGIKGMRERARLLGGDLKIESEPGEGTEVRFELALEKEREKAEKEQQEEEEEEEMRILLVEDHDTVREALAFTFEQETDFRIVGQAGTLERARQILEMEPVDVALVDLGLPDGYGGDLIKEIGEAHPRTQVLVLSASLDRAEIARALEAGAAEVLPKTTPLDEVVETVRHAVGRA